MIARSSGGSVAVADRRLMPAATPADAKAGGDGDSGRRRMLHGHDPVRRRRCAAPACAPARTATLRSSEWYIAYWSQRRNSGQPTQSVAIFSGSHRCGTMEKFWRTKKRASCVKAQSVSNPAAFARLRSSSTQPRRQADATEILRDDERTDFRHPRRQRRQFRARLDRPVDVADDESAWRDARARRARAAAGVPRSNAR